MIRKTLSIVLLFIKCFLPLSAQEIPKKNHLLVYAGIPREKLLDKNTSNTLWCDNGFGAGLEYEAKITGRLSIKTGFSYSGSHLYNPGPNLQLKSTNIEIWANGSWKLINKPKNWLGAGICLRASNYTRAGDIPYLEQVHDLWKSMEIGLAYGHQIKKFTGAFDISVPIITTLTTQAYVNNGIHSTYWPTLDNAFKIQTNTGVYYGFDHGHTIGVHYSWGYYHININKRIDRAEHLLKISYGFQF